MSAHLCCVVAMFLLGGLSAHAAEAQRAESAKSSASATPTLTAAVRTSALERVAQLLQASDTAGAIDVLRQATATAPKDAHLWHAYGMLLSEWNKPYRRKWVMPAGIAQRFLAADTALALAMELAPDSASYAIHYAENLFNASQWSFAKAMRVQASAATRAEGIGDTLSLARSRDALGLFYWRRYETVAHRRYSTLVLQHAPNTVPIRASLNRDLFDNGTRAFDPPLGEALYVEAETNFRRARELDIDDELAFRHEAMLLADRSRWDEMAAIAAARTRARPAQQWPWFALGIAEHRRGHDREATIALDSAYARLSASERERLSSLSRLLASKQQRHFDTLSAASKDQLARSFFDVANPTLLTGGNVFWNEFRARVAFSELMWTNEQMKVRGVDSDRGEAMVRWGPPDNIWTTAPAFDGVSSLNWLYRTTGLLLTFRTPPTYGTAFFDPETRSNIVEPEIDLRPSRWDNLGVFRRGIDSLPVQVVRFRRTADSLDLAVFAGVRAGALRAGLPTDTSVLKTGIFAISVAGDVQTRVTDVVRTGERDTLALTAKAWRATVPSTAWYLRVEALETDALRVARAIRDVSGFPTSGFGVSDLLIGDGITAPSAEDGARWSDYRFAAVSGNALRVGRPVDLLWEVYAPAIREGNVHYRVSVSVQRVEATGLRGVVARLGGRVRDATVRSSGTNRIAVEYDRTAVATAQRAETVRLDLGGAKAGKYLMTLTVTDLVSGATAITHRDVVLVN